MTDLWPPLAATRINLAEESDFDLGGMRVHPAELAVEMNGQRHELQPRVMQVLVALAKARPAVVSRDKLVEFCWEGRIVGDDALNRCVLALRHLAQQFTPEPFTIETVPRVGHRLVETGAGEAPARTAAASKRWPHLAAAVALLLVAVIGLFVWQQRSADAEPASIAVLPFRNLSDGDPYFAEGVGEEILGQLAREPAFRVAGRASAAQFTNNSDPRVIGRKLGVDYILEGSVRSDQGRVRINASLVQTRDGMRLWSETYDRKLEDILAIQTAIGGAVANGLKRELVHLAVAGVRPINGEAYALYLNARGLLRSQNPQAGPDAVQTLKEAIRLDLRFAPAWSSLADALVLDGRTKGPEGLIAVVPQAHQAARRALELDANLAQAHGVLGHLLGSETPEAIAHLRRAAELDPRSGEGMMWRAVANEVSGHYSQALADYHRAHELDPAWPIPLRALVNVYPIMGDRRTAEAIAKSSFADDVTTREFALGRVAWHSGDLSEAARGWSLVTRNPSARFYRSATMNLEDVRHTLGQTRTPPVRPPGAIIGSQRFGPRVWSKAPPSPAEWRQRNRSVAATLVYYDENIVAAKLMLNAGRARELVATYDSPTGLLSVRKGRRLGPCQLDEAALAAQALRAVGRGREAESMLREADRLVQTLYRRGAVPIWLEEDAAGIWAMQGKTGPAVEALGRALRRGWVHVGRTDLPGLAEEPAFRGLRGDPRFKAVLARYQAHFARERQETARALKIEI